MLRYPYLHREAILRGLKSEQASHLLEDIVEAQLQHLEKPDVSEDARFYYEQKTKSVQHALSSTGYKAEHSINHRLSLTLEKLLTVARTNTIYCGRDQAIRVHINQTKCNPKNPKPKSLATSKSQKLSRIPSRLTPSTRSSSPGKRRNRRGKGKVSVPSPRSCPHRSANLYRRTDSPCKLQTLNRSSQPGTRWSSPRTSQANSIQHTLLG